MVIVAIAIFIVAVGVAYVAGKYAERMKAVWSICLIAAFVDFDKMKRELPGDSAKVMGVIKSGRGLADCGKLIIADLKLKAEAK